MNAFMTVVLFGTIVLLFIGYCLLLRDILSNISLRGKESAVPLRDIIFLAIVATLLLFVGVCFAILLGLTVSKDPTTLWRALRM